MKDRSRSSLAGSSGALAPVASGNPHNGPHLVVSHSLLDLLVLCQSNYGRIGPTDRARSKGILDDAVDLLRNEDDAEETNHR